MPGRCLAYVSEWRQRDRDRRLLQRFDERALRDLGVERAAVGTEGPIPFWSLQIPRYTVL